MNFEELQELALHILSISQWHILLLVLVATASLTESFKRLLIISGKKRDRAIYAASLILGFAVTSIATQVASNQQPLWYWLFIGVLVGPISNWLYRYTMPIFKHVLDLMYGFKLRDRRQK